MIIFHSLYESDSSSQVVSASDVIHGRAATGEPGQSDSAMQLRPMGQERSRHPATETGSAV